VIEAVRSSISVPVIFTPVKWANRFLIDGGVVNPLPVDVVRNMGAEIVVAINVATVPEPRKNGECASTDSSKIGTRGGKIDRETPNIFNVLTNIIRATECERLKSAIKTAEIVISPDLSHMETSGLNRVDEAIMRGYKAAKAMLPKLQAIIHCPSPQLLTCTA
jgi:NTE family protein